MTTATCTRVTCEGPDRSTYRYCGRHEQARRVRIVAASGDRVARRLRSRSGRQPAFRHQRGGPSAGQGDEDHHRLTARRRSPSRRTICPGTTALRKEFSQAAAPAPAGVKLDCASYDADLDPVNGAAGSLSIGVVRARSAQTPDDAGPLVFTTGSDMPSSLQLPVWLARAGADVLRSHPIVAIDRRGMGTSSPVDCLEQFDRQEIHDQAQFEAGNDPVANLADIVQTSTTSCTDAISPGDSAYDNTHAADRHRAAPQHLGCTRVSADRHRQRRPGGVVLRQRAPGQSRQAGTRLPGGAGCGRRSRRRAEGQGPAGGARRIRRPVRRGELPAGPRPERRCQRIAGRRPCRPRTGGRLGRLDRQTRSASRSVSPPATGSARQTSLATALASARYGDTNLLTSLINRAEAIHGPTGSSSTPAATRSTGPRRTGSANWWSPGPSSTPSSARSARSAWSSASLADRLAAAAAEEAQGQRAADGRAERPDRRDRKASRPPPPPSSTPTRPASG